MKLGDIVRLTAVCLGNPKGTLGYVYQEYPDFDGPYTSVSVIFENGEYDGFSAQEQFLMLEYVRSTDFEYHFKNVMKLSQDYNNKVFKFLENKDEC